MYGATMGTLRLVDAASSTVWTRTGQQTTTSWQTATVPGTTASFHFEYTRGGSFTGDAAVDDVTVSCIASPPPPAVTPSAAAVTLTIAVTYGYSNSWFEFDLSCDDGGALSCLVNDVDGDCAPRSFTTTLQIGASCTLLSTNSGNPTYSQTVSLFPGDYGPYSLGTHSFTVAPPPPPHPPPPPGFVLEGPGYSLSQDVLGTYAGAGYTAKGVAYYRRTTSPARYFYYDDCYMGQSQACLYDRGGWAIDDEAPNLASPYDLDGDGAYPSNARLESQDSASLPVGEQSWWVRSATSGGSTSVPIKLTLLS